MIKQQIYGVWAALYMNYSSIISAVNKGNWITQRGNKDSYLEVNPVFHFRHVLTTKTRLKTATVRIS